MEHHPKGKDILIIIRALTGTELARLHPCGTLADLQGTGSCGRHSVWRVSSSPYAWTCSCPRPVPDAPRSRQSGPHLVFWILQVGIIGLVLRVFIHLRDTHPHGLKPDWVHDPHFDDFHLKGWLPVNLFNQTFQGLVSRQPDTMTCHRCILTAALCTLHNDRIPGIQTRFLVRHNWTPPVSVISLHNFRGAATCGPFPPYLPHYINAAFNLENSSLSALTFLFHRCEKFFNLVKNKARRFVLPTSSLF